MDFQPFDDLTGDPVFTGIVGSNYQRYVHKWRSMFTRKGQLDLIASASSWNWAAFFITFIWLCYRRQFLRATLVVLLILLIFVLGLAAGRLDDQVGAVVGIAASLIILAIPIYVAIRADAWVFGSAYRRYAQVPGGMPVVDLFLTKRDPRVPLIVGNIVAIAGIVCALVVPKLQHEAYSKYTTRQERLPPTAQTPAPPNPLFARTTPPKPAPPRIDQNFATKLSPDAQKFMRSIAGVWQNTSEERRFVVKLTFLEGSTPAAEYTRYEDGKQVARGVTPFSRIQFDDSSNRIICSAPGETVILQKIVSGDSKFHISILSDALPEQSLGYIRDLTPPDLSDIEDALNRDPDQ